jgi:hypothetical protein
MAIFNDGLAFSSISYVEKEIRLPLCDMVDKEIPGIDKDKRC